MSYILDALKKSEREKTLGQVPTLGTVISDGAKKQRTGIPWWMNLLIFLLVLLAVLAVMYFTGLFKLDSEKESASETVSASTKSQLEEDLTQQAIVTAPENQVVIEQQDEQIEEGLQLIEVVDEAQQAVEPVEIASDSTETDAVTEVQEQSLAEQQTEELAALERVIEPEPLVVELLAQESIPQIQQPAETELASIENQSEPDYEEALHQKLRNVAVNVVSYSSDARQRFVMLDLTIYKEGDSMQNGADIVEIIRTGAIVEFQNKHYLLKP